MNTVDEILDAVKTRHKITSDYKLAHFLGLSEGAIRNYRHGRSLPDEIVCTRLGNALNIDGDILAAQVQARRAATIELRIFWQRIAQRLQAGTVAVMFLMISAMLSIASYSPNAYATALSASASNERVCALC